LLHFQLQTRSSDFAKLPVDHPHRGSGQPAIAFYRISGIEDRPSFNYKHHQHSVFYRRDTGVTGITEIIHHLSTYAMIVFTTVVFPFRICRSIPEPAIRMQHGISDRYSGHCLDLTHRV